MNLQNKIFLLFFILLLVVQSVVMLTVTGELEEQEQEQITLQLDKAKTISANLYEERNYYLSAFAETVAKDYGLKQVFTDDTKSLLVALNNHRARINADMAIAISSNGSVIGQLLKNDDATGDGKVAVGPEQGGDFRFIGWFEQIDRAYLYPLENRFYQLSMAPLKSGSVVIGWVGFGYSIDQSMAQDFSSLTGFTTDIVVKATDSWRLHASSKSGLGELELASETVLVNQLANKQMPKDIIALTYPLGNTDKTELMAIMYGYRSILLESIQQRWQELLVLALFTLLISLLGAYLIATSIGRPVKQLVRQAKEIGRGNYEMDVEVEGRDEISQLAMEFNEMKSAVIHREKFISHQAYHDAITDLPNRNKLEQLLDDYIEEGLKEGLLLYVSVQGLKDVNYSLGHEVGDALLIEAGRRLQLIANEQSLFHLGGSVFGVFYKDINHRGLAEVLSKLQSSFDSPYEIQSLTINPQVHAGIAIYPQHAGSAQDLLQNAGTAFQHAQRNNSFSCIYDPTLTSNTVERLYLVNGLKTAIDEGQLVLFYQPKLDIATARIVSVEALVRWQHPTQGMISPDKFVHLAEQAGQIDALTFWVLDESARQYLIWRERGLSLTISVNISAENFKDDNFYQKIMDFFERFDLPRNAICLEITESVVVDDPDKTIAVLHKFKQAGIRLSVDDYGTGYSSLAQLKEMPVCEMKVDKAFVMRLVSNNADQLIVKSTIELAHAMGLQVVAEGVEDRDTLNWLSEHGCDQAQGFYISKPESADRFIRWLYQSEYGQAMLQKSSG